MSVHNLMTYFSPDIGDGRYTVCLDLSEKACPKYTSINMCAVVRDITLQVPFHSSSMFHSSINSVMETVAALWD